MVIVLTGGQIGGKDIESINKSFEFRKKEYRKKVDIEVKSNSLNKITGFIVKLVFKSNWISKQIDIIVRIVCKSYFYFVKCKLYFETKNHILKNYF